jgi:hypothetical protein
MLEFVNLAEVFGLETLCRLWTEIGEVLAHIMKDLGEVEL